MLFPCMTFWRGEWSSWWISWKEWICCCSQICLVDPTFLSYPAEYLLVFVICIIQDTSIALFSKFIHLTSSNFTCREFHFGAYFSCFLSLLLFFACQLFFLLGSYCFIVLILNLNRHISVGMIHHFNQP